jgi:hypothetical protein
MVLQGYLFIQKIILKLEERFTLAQKADIADFYLRQDIQFSGYKGYRSCDCSLLDINHVNSLNKLIFKNQVLIAKNVFPGCQTKELPKKIADKISKQEIIANTDILFIKDIPKAIYKLAIPIRDLCAAIEIKDHFTPPLHNDSLLAIADIKSIERFVASRIIANKYIYRELPENNNTCLQHAHDIDAEIIVLQWVVYYLAKHATAETYTLYRDDIINNAEGILDGIEDFYVRLINEDKEQTNIIGAEISILLRSEAKLFGEQVLIWRDKTLRFTDGYLRSPITFTMAMRNVC